MLEPIGNEINNKMNQIDEREEVRIYSVDNQVQKIVDENEYKISQTTQTEVISSHNLKYKESFIINQEEELIKLRNKIKKTELLLIETEKYYSISQDDFEKLKIELQTLKNKNHLKENQFQTEIKSLINKNKAFQFTIETILNENNKMVEENKKDNLNHLDMYRIYENEIEKLKMEKKEAKSETIQLNRLLNTKNEEIETMSNELIELKGELQNYKEIKQNEIHVLTQNSEEMKIEINKLQTENKKMINENLIETINDKKELNKISEENNLYQTKIIQQESMIGQLESEKLSLKEQIEDYSWKMEIIKSDIEFRDNKLQNLINQNKELLQTINNKKELNKISEENNSYQTKIIQQESIIGQLESEKLSLKEQMEDYFFKNEIIKLDLELTDNKLQNLINQNKELLQTINNNKIELNKISEENNSYQTKIIYQELLISQLKDDKLSLKEQMDKLNIEHVCKETENLKNKDKDLNNLNNYEIDNRISIVNKQLVETSLNCELQEKHHVDSRDFGTNVNMME